VGSPESGRWAPSEGSPLQTIPIAAAAVHFEAVPECSAIRLLPVYGAKGGQNGSTSYFPTSREYEQCLMKGRRVLLDGGSKVLLEKLPDD
jgi:hypothetical protein